MVQNDSILDKILNLYLQMSLLLLKAYFLFHQQQYGPYIRKSDTSHEWRVHLFGDLLLHDQKEGAVVAHPCRVEPAGQRSRILFFSTGQQWNLSCESPVHSDDVGMSGHSLRHAPEMTAKKAEHAKLTVIFICNTFFLLLGDSQD